MKLSQLHVLNYRGLRNVSIPLSSFVCITGENNGGKSSILQSLSLFLSGSALKATDYFDTSLTITIAVTLSDVTPEDLTLLADEHRDRIAALVVDKTLTLVRLYGTDGKSQLGYYGLVPKEARYSSENVAALVAGKKGGQLKDAVLAVFPELAGQVNASTTQGAVKDFVLKLGDALPAADKTTQFIPLPTGLDKSVIPMLPERIYIPAVKDLADDTKTAETSSFGKILAIVMKAIEPLLADEKDLFEKLAAIVDVVAPQPGQAICDAACGTGGFLLASHDYIAKHHALDRAQKKKLKCGTLFGIELVDSVARLCCMNLLLHGIGESGTGSQPVGKRADSQDGRSTLEDEVPVLVKDALAGKHGEYDLVLANPPFGKRSSVTIVNEAGETSKESLIINRDDFWASTSNKQLNFLQHIFTILKQHGRAAVVLPDNVLFEGGAGETIRRALLKQADESSGFTTCEPICISRSRKTHSSARTSTISSSVTT